jgi:hypothetical protein
MLAASVKAVAFVDQAPLPMFDELFEYGVTADRKRFLIVTAGGPGRRHSETAA